MWKLTTLIEGLIVPVIAVLGILGKYNFPFKHPIWITKWMLAKPIIAIMLSHFSNFHKIAFSWMKYWFGLAFHIYRSQKIMLLLTGNIACLIVFNQKSVDLLPSFSNILKCLSIFDILFLVSVHKSQYLTYCFWWVFISFNSYKTNTFQISLRLLKKNS